MELTSKTRFYKPDLVSFEQNGIDFALDGDSPNWISTDERGAWLLKSLDDEQVFSRVVTRYAEFFKLDIAKSWLHVDTFLQDALQHEMISISPIQREPYRGRPYYLKPTRLHELWLHTNNSCNLICAHCLVNSSPSGEKGLPLEKWLSLVNQAVELGVYRFYITGGEPFIRRDLVQLVHHITEIHKLELIILTNATQFQREELLQQLDRFDRKRLKFQISLDGATPQTNDAIRGTGSFQATLQGIKKMMPLHFDVTLTTVATAGNLKELPDLTRLAKELGIRTQHFMWLHRKGRILEDGDGFFPSMEPLIEAIRRTKKVADEVGISLDNYESMKLRINGPRGVKYDLGNAGWQSFCIYADGHVYPSAALANIRSLDCGDAANGVSLKDIWLKSPILEAIRQTSIVRQKDFKKDPFRFLLGGGDLELSHGEGDPYYPLYKEIALDVMTELVLQKCNTFNHRSGFDAPIIFHGMGDGAIVCGMSEVGEEGIEVAFLHSNCVLSFDVEKPRRLVQEFYTEAAKRPQKELCCPTQFDDSEISHIPQEVIERFYGCGSPVSRAQVKVGETYLDLGSGAGIDCFIAAKKVGPSGRVIGIDMTDEMLKVAQENRPIVAQRLGYDAVEFHKGYLEQIPIPDKSVDVITSNCVINLSPNKPAVFAEIWRVLKDHGRVVIADIVSSQEAPVHLKVNPQLWGECTVGALTEAQFLAMLERSGFYGLSILKKVYWRSIEGYDFYSVTVQGFKFEKTKGCQFIGQKAIYQGPLKAVMDEEGHLFPRNEAIEICTDTAAKLREFPYRPFFTVVQSDGTADESNSCCAEVGGSCC